MLSVRVKPCVLCHSRDELLVRDLLILLSVLVCSCQKDFATKYGYREPQVPSDIPHYKQPVVGARGYDTPDPGETIIDLHKRYLYTHKRAFCEAAEQWERDGRFDYRSFRDVVSMDFTWEGKRGPVDSYQLFKRQICQKEASSGVTPFILAMSVDITTEPPAWDSQDVIFVMEWNRTTSSDPHNVAAYATASRENELKQWQRQQPGRLHVADHVDHVQGSGFCVDCNWPVRPSAPRWPASMALRWRRVGSEDCHGPPGILYGPRCVGRNSQHYLRWSTTTSGDERGGPIKPCDEGPAEISKVRFEDLRDRIQPVR